MNKSEMIPEEWKENIDNILEEQLFNANRYYAEANPQLANIINNTSKMQSTKFYKELKKRWEWHNNFYENILEPNIDIYLEKNSTELTPKDVQNLINIYKTICKIDQATLAMSGAIKKHLNYNLKNMLTYKPFGKVDQNEVLMSLTPPTDTFFVKYHVDHILYKIAQKSNDKEKIDKMEKYLLEKYHANDRKIFESRLKKFDEYSNMSIEELYKCIKEYEISNDYKVKHFYFTMENEEKKAFRDILSYDNLEEKQISKSLIGISGFMLRKKILEYLSEEGLLENSGYIYEFSDDIIEEKLNELLKRREQQMDKNVTPYKQRGPTCAISCLMMALDYNKKIPKPNNLMERELYKKYSSDYMEGTPFSALAVKLAKMGLNTNLVHSEQHLFKNENEYLPEKLFNLSMQEYQDYIDIALKNNATIETNKQINSHTIKQKLQDDDLIILAGQTGPFLHAILVTGYDKDEFIICDPQMKQKKKVSAQELEKFMDTPIGKWCVEVKNPNENNSELINECKCYYKQAQEFLGEDTKKHINIEGDANER